MIKCVKHTSTFSLSPDNNISNNISNMLRFSLCMTIRLDESHMRSRFENMNTAKQNRSTEGCLKLERSVDMTSSGKNGLNIRNASPKWDRTRFNDQRQQN